MRDRLVELIQDSVQGCARNWAEVIADYLLANGVIVLPCKVGETVYADITNRRNGDFIDECIVKEIEWNADWDDPLFTIICRERATYRLYWASEFGNDFFKEPRCTKKKGGE